jgi:hypothetical protein
MKWLTRFTIVCTLLIVLTLLTAVHAGARAITGVTDIDLYHTDAPSLVVTLSRQISYPAQPGEELTLVIKTTNCGDEPAQNIVWYLDAKEPFELKETGEATQTLPELRCGETANTEYFLSVDPDARSGEYVIDLNVTYSGDFDRNYLTTMGTFEITVRVMGDPDLVLIDADLPEADPKSEFDAKFSIKNVGTGPAKNVKVSFGSQSGISSEVPNEILPKTSISYIDTIAPGETAIVESSFFVDTTTPSQYPLPITIQYENETHGAQSAQFYSVLVPVTSGNTLFVYLDSQERLTPETVGEITIGVANRGLARAKHVVFTISEGEQFKLIDTGTRYIGDIESDDYDTADFVIIPEVAGEGSVSVKVDYADDYGNQYSRTADVPIKVYSPEEMKAIAPQGGGYTGVIIGAVVLVLAYVFRKRIKRIISR